MAMGAGDLGSDQPAPNPPPGDAEGVKGEASGGLLTVLFTDLVGSTELAVSRGDDSARSIRRQHDQLVRKQLAAHGGREVQTTGDGFLVTFSSVRKAIDCACAIQRAQLEHNRRHADQAVSLRVGLNAGEVSPRDDGLFGSAVNLAARVMAKAGPGEILVSEVVKQLAGTIAGVEFQDRGRFRLRGFPERWRLYELSGSPEVPHASPTEQRWAQTDGDGIRESGQLPAPRSSFVGRADEVIQVAQLVASHRLVTLTGSGGVGKTRLAIQVARVLAFQFGSGVPFVDLSSVAEGELIDQAVLLGLGLHGDPARGARNLVTGYLRERQSLLVLDNCEHVIESSAVLLEHLLDRCPQLHVLATSREPLMIEGEHVRQVPPLELPDAHQALREDALQRHSALQLFTERAEEAGAALPIRPQDVAIVAQICRRLDGLPLALELAAARMRAMSPADLLDQLDQQRFRVLTRANRTADDRHRTLRATVEWSHRLLTEEERLLFARLSIFAGPFDLRAAQHLGSLPPIAAEAVPVLLSGLVDKSLVTVSAGPAGEPRYRLLDTLRAFGRERLAELDEYETLRRRQAEHYAELFAEPLMSWTRTALDLVQDQMDDLRAALDWSCTNEPELINRICPVGFWGRQGHLGEGCQWMERLIAQLANDDSHKAVAFANACWLACRHGSFDRAEEYALQEQRIARLVADDWAIADSLKRLADVARQRGDYEAARRHAEESLAIRKALRPNARDRKGNQQEIALSLMILGSAEGRQGDVEAGRLHLEEARSLFAAMDEDGGVALCQAWLGELALRECSFRQASEQLSGSLRIFRDMPDAWMVANVLDLLTWLASEEGEDYRALALTAAAASLRDRIGAAQLPVLREPLEARLQASTMRLGLGSEAARRQGGQAGPAEAIAYALREVDWEAPVHGGAHTRSAGEI
jgi:predicted ATPase/class 3 adenylate cyclase